MASLDTLTFDELDLLSFSELNILPMAVYGSFFPFVISFDALTLTLPGPLFNDTESKDFTRISRTTRGLTQDVFRDSTWPDGTTLQWVFTDRPKSDVDDFLEIVEASAGLLIDITDYKDIEYEGFITEHSTSQPRKGCGYTISFTFETVS